MNNKIQTLGAALLILVWGALAAACWLLPDRDISESERRPLAQAPEISAQSLLSGEFMEDFDNYTLDQFPLRDSFRKLKSLFHFYGLGQKDNNQIYLAQGHAVKQEYPLKEESLDHALNRFNRLYEKYLRDKAASVHMAIVPDKGYYLGEENGQLTLDYERLFETFTQGMPWAGMISLTEHLSAEDYYRTDIHWRQENLLEAAEAICEALGIPAPEESEFRQEALQRPFYGVYYGQAALPMEPDVMNLLRSDLLDGCRVYDYESGTWAEVYDMEKLDSRDLYDVFLSGSRSLLTVENPNTRTDRELILFRDSFGSSMAPLLMQGYAKIHLVDIRYIQLEMLDRFLSFEGRDVLLLYSTPVLNNSQTIK